MKTNRNIATAAGICLLILMLAADLSTGSHADKTTMTMLRLPRAATAILAGAALALAGVQMQSIFRNPIADPHIMGVSSGASFGAAAAALGGTLISGWQANAFPTAAAAVAGAAASAAVIMAAAQKVRNAATLLIFGIMLGFMANAAVAVMQFNTDAESLKIFYNWSAGSFSYTSWNQIGIMAAATAAGYAAAAFNRKGLDILLFGDEYAQACGASPRRIRLTAMFSCCLTTGITTAFCGPIGFVGIISPHIAKTILGTSSHRITLAGSMLCGSIISVAADLISQSQKLHIPVSGTMAFVGLPIIFHILLKKSEI